MIFRRKSKQKLYKFSLAEKISARAGKEIWRIKHRGAVIAVFSVPEFRFGITENRRFSGSCDVIATARSPFRYASLKRTNS